VRVYACVLVPAESLHTYTHKAHVWTVDSVCTVLVLIKLKIKVVCSSGSQEQELGRVFAMRTLDKPQTTATAHA